MTVHALPTRGPGRPALPADEKKEQRLRVLLDERMLADFQDLAKRHGESTSGYARRLIVDALNAERLQRRA